MPDSTLKIGKYEIISELGRGAMGVVYKGLDPVINRFVAIKTLALHRSEEEAVVLAERFKQEAQAAGRLNHPNIVSVYEYGEDQERAFIAMEFVDGYTLADQIKRKGVLELDEIWDLMLSVLDALHYAHSKGIVHRDIKPSNVMRTNNGEVKIADFGIARIESSELTQVGTVIGTPGYMSPEQLLGHRVDHGSDIFSCGILLYELLTGERAFASTNITSTIYKVVHSDLPPASKLSPTVPQAIDAVLVKALAKNPADRFRTAKAFADAIRSVAAGEPQVAAPGMPRPSDDDRTVIKPPMPQNDDKTVVMSPVPRADDWLNAPSWGTESEKEQPSRSFTNKKGDEESGTGSRPQSRAAWNKPMLAIMGVIVVVAALTAALIRSFGGGDARKVDISPKPASSTSASDDSTRSVTASAQKSPAVEPAYTAGATFKDCEACPGMVVVPPGSFVQGSPATEPDRELNEGPQHAIQIAYPLAVGQYEITRGQFAQFAADTKYEAAGCWVYDGSWRLQNTGSWRSPGFTQTDEHPVTCVSWDDAEAYINWLSTKTRKKYRLLTSAEWEYIARAGSETARVGGDNPAGACVAGNVADRSAAAKYPDWKVHACTDGYVYTAPIGSFSPNKFGVYDMLGNVFEWVSDCWNDSYRNAPTDGSAWLQGDCGKRVLRGASWFSMPQYSRFAFRNHFERGRRSATFGFRVARLLQNDVPQGASAPLESRPTQ
ncbi:MAG: bifunctional serine/threonine-protein kinase/formylglycine-generating enzyme family protein [Gammaproteobacteria bacterium]